MLKLVSFGDKNCPLFNEYLKRVRMPKDNLVYPSSTNLKKVNEIFEKAFATKGYKVICDEKGENLTSIEFASFLNKFSDITFIVGPFCGIPDMFKIKADKTISFGKMTWPHELARIMLIEQIYRAQQITAGHPYHKE